jgi:multidrug efflux pump subunit AcrA (membrane-fusion protein)
MSKFWRIGCAAVTALAVAPWCTAQTGGPAYPTKPIRIENVRGQTPKIMRLVPGMQVNAEIHLGTRSVLEYLLSPVQRVAHEAGRER